MGIDVVDIDLEAIRDLEFSMFEEGIGEEWGLDTDSHQSNWEPYATYTRGFGPRNNAPSTENKIVQETIEQTAIAPNPKKVWIMTSWMRMLCEWLTMKSETWSNVGFDCRAFTSVKTAETSEGDLKKTTGLFRNLALTWMFINEQHWTLWKPLFECRTPCSLLNVFTLDIIVMLLWRCCDAAVTLLWRCW